MSTTEIAAIDQTHSARTAPEEPLSDRIYRELRGQIISGTLAQGTRLRERDLAVELGVSRIPLREALPQLEADGYIQTTLRRGAMVTQLTLRDVEDLFDARLGIEVHASRLAAKRVVEGVSPAPIVEALKRSDKALATKNANKIAEANADLHEQIVWITNNDLMAKMMRSISGRYRWIFRMTFTSDSIDSCQEHYELCDAIYAGDADFAGAVSFAHVERGRKPTLDALGSLLPAR
jgi:DNA-binding GntR family transcriptional regulator